MSIVLALPSKGRLRDQTLEAMSGAGFAVREGLEAWRGDPCCG